MSNVTSVRMETEMSVVNAGAQREQLLAALDGVDAGLALDLGPVDSIDSAGVQLLLATRRSLARQSATLTLDGIGPAVSEALQVYGLQTLLRAVTGSAA